MSLVRIIKLHFPGRLKLSLRVEKIKKQSQLEVVLQLMVINQQVRQNIKLNQGRLKKLLRVR